MKDKSSESFYAGKKVAYIYKADKAKSGSKLRAVWGKLTRAHGSNGLFRAKFKRNLAVSDAFLFPRYCVSYLFVHRRLPLAQLFESSCIQVAFN